MNNTALQTIVTKSLPALSGESFTYNPARNMFVTPGYTSAGGNTYFKAIRFSDRLIVYYDLSLGSEQFAKDQSVLMLCNYLLGQLKAQGAHVSNQEIFSYAYNMIEETQRKQLA